MIRPAAPRRTGAAGASSARAPGRAARDKKGAPRKGRAFLFARAVEGRGYFFRLYVVSPATVMWVGSEPGWV